MAASTPKVDGEPMPNGLPDVLKLTGAPASSPPMPVTSCSMLPGTDTDASISWLPAVAGFDSVRNCGGMAMGGSQFHVAYPARTIWRFDCCVVATVMHSMRGTIRRFGSGSTAIRVLVPVGDEGSKMTPSHTIVPRAAATAVGVEMPKLD